MDPATLIRRGLEALPSTPPDDHRGRGIVMCAGGHRLLANGYVALRRLRAHTALPVEMVHSGEDVPGVLQEGFAREFAPLRWRDLAEGGPHLLGQPPHRLRGVHMKPFALLAASFAEVLLVDADNLALADVEPLFELPGYRHAGAQFWPDVSRTTQDDLYTFFALDSALNRATPEFESGQLLLDKSRVWRLLLATCLFSSTQHTQVYSRTGGDKDVFRLAAWFTGTEFDLVAVPPRTFGAQFIIRGLPGGRLLKLDHPRGGYYATGLLQHHPDGRPLFAHRTVMEWKAQLDSVAMTHVEGQPAPWLAALEAEGQAHLTEFRRRYGRLFPPDRGEQAQAWLRKAVLTGVPSVCYR